MVQSQIKNVWNAIRVTNELLEPRILKVLRKLKIRPFAITAPSKRGSLQVSVYQMHAFIVIDLHGVTCLCSYRRFVTAGN